LSQRRDISTHDRPTVELCAAAVKNAEIFYRKCPSDITNITKGGLRAAQSYRDTRRDRHRLLPAREDRADREDSSACGGSHGVKDASFPHRAGYRRVQICLIVRQQNALDTTAEFRSQCDERTRSLPEVVRKDSLRTNRKAHCLKVPSHLIALLEEYRVFVPEICVLFAQFRYASRGGAILICEPRGVFEGDRNFLFIICKVRP